VRGFCDTGGGKGKSHGRISGVLPAKTGGGSFIYVKSKYTRKKGTLKTGGKSKDAEEGGKRVGFRRGT